MYNILQIHRKHLFEFQNETIFLNNYFVDIYYHFDS